MSKNHSKRYNEARKIAGESKKHKVEEAVNLLSKLPKTKFDETVELSLFLGVDPKQGNQMVRGTVSLPHGSGKSVRVIVFTENPEEAMAAGAEHAGLEDLLKKIEDGWMDFDVAISTTSAMKEVRKAARVLGPRGLMPNPKSGTVTDDIPAGIEAVKAGRVEFKMDKTANMAVIVGKRSFDAQKLVENVHSAIEAVRAAKPEGIKGVYVKKIKISSTMSPALELDLKELGAF